MGDRIQPFWQSRVKSTVQKAVQKVPAATSSDTLDSPSLPVLNGLLTKINQLPPPLPCQHAVQNALVQAIRVWQADPEIANNSLVVLGRPVEDTAKIIKASLQTWPTDDSFPVNVTFHMGGYQRPLDPLDIDAHVRKAFPLKKVTATTATEESTNTDSKEMREPLTEENVPTLMVVPRLEQLFLRCIQGWEGIEYLQNLTTRDPSCFWVFGCNHWAWAFLDRVCQVSAYLEQPLRLPELTGEDLQHWLSPLFSEPLSLSESDCPLQLEMASDTVWQSLSKVSSGIGATAARVWLTSLQIANEPASGEQLSESPISESPISESLTSESLTSESLTSDNLTSDNPVPNDSISNSSVTTLSMGKPTLPPLMALDAMDRYILYALLVHGEITRAHLALSLGEAERKIRARLQVLRREGIILQRGRRLSVNPAHYPRLYGKLKNNNFLIGEI